MKELKKRSIIDQSLLPTVVWVLVVVGLGFYALDRGIMIAEKWLRNQAVDACLQVAVKEEKVNEWITTRVPMVDEYQSCMGEKGY